MSHNVRLYFKAFMAAVRMFLLFWTVIWYYQIILVHRDALAKAGKYTVLNPPGFSTFVVQL